VAFWNRRGKGNPAAEVELVRVVKEEPYIPKPRAVAIADWTCTYSDGTKVTVKATHISDSHSYVYLDSSGGWNFSSDTKALMKEIFFYDTVWGESQEFGKSTARLVARVTAVNLRAVTSDNWRQEDRGIW
jgi:hypothetical protein